MITSLLQAVLRSHFAVVFAGLTIGIVYADTFAPYADKSLWVLCAIFFLSALKFNLTDALAEVRDVKTISYIVAVILIVSPIVAYLLVRALYPPLALPTLLLMAMPAGMTTVALSDIAGGRSTLALVLAVVTSLLAPFTIPLLLAFFADASVELSKVDMFLRLAKIILIPFVLAQLMRRYGSRVIVRVKPFLPHLSILLIGLLNTLIISEHAGTMLTGLLDGTYVPLLLCAVLAFAALHAIGYHLVFWKDRMERITVAISFTYMNISLALYLAGAFFNSALVVAPIVLSIVPWTLMLQPFMYALAYTERGAKKLDRA